MKIFFSRDELLSLAPVAGHPFAVGSALARELVRVGFAGEGAEIDLTPEEAREALRVLRSVGARTGGAPRPDYYDKLRVVAESIGV